MINLNSHTNHIIINNYFGNDGALPFVFTERFLDNGYAEEFEFLLKFIFVQCISKYNPNIIYHLRAFINPTTIKRTIFVKVSNPEILGRGVLGNFRLDRYIVYQDHVHPQQGYCIIR